MRVGTQHRIQHSRLYTSVDACGVTSTVTAQDVVIHQRNDFWRIIKKFIFWMESILRVCNSYHAFLHQINYTAYNRKVINTGPFACVCARMLVYIWNIIHLNSHSLIGHYFQLLKSCSSFLGVPFLTNKCAKVHFRLQYMYFPNAFCAIPPLSFALMFIYCWYKSCSETIKIPFPVLSLNAYCQLILTMYALNLQIRKTVLLLRFSV
jgi:hypothetical protein